MVVRRTIRHMRERPHDERRAFAGTVAIVVIVILLLAWAATFFAELHSTLTETSRESGTAAANASQNDALPYGQNTSAGERAATSSDRVIILPGNTIQ